jgi:DNA-binding transcriptional LysR family regulator
MEMHQLRYALAVHEHRNFTHAAKASNVSQPALTAAIAKLEAELGGPLFLRDRSGCRPTALGRLVRPRFARILAEHEAAKGEAVRHVRLDRVPIAIGSGGTIGAGRIAPALAAFRRTVPRADIEVIVADHAGLREGLDEGRLEVAITSAATAAPRGSGDGSEGGSAGRAAPFPIDLYSTVPLYTEGYVVAMATGHPLADRHGLRLADLAGADLLDRPNCEMRDTLHAACAEEGIDLYAAYRSNRVDWLLQMAAEGMGVVVLPETAVPATAHLVTRMLADTPIERTVSAVRKRHQPSRPEVEKLVADLARKCGAASRGDT